MQIPHDFPDDAPLPDGGPRCGSVFEGRRCVRRAGHEAGTGKSPRHHIAADQSRWTVGRKSGLARRLEKCGALYGEYRCDRWPHAGPHGAPARAPQGSPPRGERVQWIGNGSAARQYAPDAGGGSRSGGARQARLLRR